MTTTTTGASREPVSQPGTGREPAGSRPEASREPAVSRPGAGRKPREAVGSRKLPGACREAEPVKTLPGASREQAGSPGSRLRASRGPAWSVD